MSGAHVLSGIHNVVSGTVRHSPNKLIAWMSQINIYYSHRMMSDGVITLMAKLSKWFTGCTEVIAELKRHFFDTNDSDQKRKFFLLHGVGGIGKTQICLKFIEEMSDW